jgi:hypothetical protein
MCCKLPLLIDLEELPKPHSSRLHLFRVPPNDWGDTDKVLAVTDEAELEVASLTTTVSTGAGGIGRAALASQCGCEFWVFVALTSGCGCEFWVLLNIAYGNY